MEEPAQAAPRVELRAVAPEDDEFLLEVYASSRADEMALATHWTDEQKRAFLRWQLGAQRADYERNYPGADYDVILVDGRPAGRLWVERTREGIHLLDIALLPWAQRRGVGASLVGELIEEARASGKSLSHTVFITNDGARRFYERLGFVVTGEAGGAYLLMEWREPNDKAARAD
ncbi:MAG: GNAT family N-acetyltransferase [Acidobacteria bacterium]|nr:GNAT family N-acetyltransferase [Acidobacteriota bacterium]